MLLFSRKKRNFEGKKIVTKFQKRTKKPDSLFYENQSREEEEEKLNNVEEGTDVTFGFYYLGSSSFSGSKSTGSCV